MSNEISIKHNINLLRKKLIDANINTVMGCVTIATSADMLSGEKSTKPRFSRIINNKQQCRTIRLSLIQDITRLIAAKAIPKILVAADPTSQLSQASFVTDATSDAIGVITENKFGIPAFKTAAVLNAFSAGTQIKTMWDIQAIEDEFSRSPRQFKILFSEWCNWNIAEKYRISQ